MEVDLSKLPILVHTYVPRVVKVGPPVDLREFNPGQFNPAVNQIAQQQFRG